MNDIVGLVAILATALAVSLVTGIDSPAFGLVLLAAIGALAYGEQRLHDTAAAPSPGANALASWNARA